MSKFCQVLQIAVPTPLRRLFDYLPPQGVDISTIQPGVRVRVPFGARSLVGFVIGVADKTDVPRSKLKAVQEVLDEQPLLPQDVYQLCNWAAEYYHYPLGEVLAAALPVWLRKGKAQIILTGSGPGPDPNEQILISLGPNDLLWAVVARENAFAWFGFSVKRYAACGHAQVLFDLLLDFLITIPVR